MTDTALALVVLYVADLDASHDFYAGLGMELVHEQHGAGPAHYSSTLDAGTVLELYPAGDGAVTRTLLVLRVPDAAESTERDPDGNTVLVMPG